MVRAPRSASARAGQFSEIVSSRSPTFGVGQGAGDVGQGDDADQGVAVDDRETADLVQTHGAQDLGRVVVGADGDGFALGEVARLDRGGV